MKRDVASVTSGVFTKRFDGSIKDVFFYQDIRELEFLQNSEGFNVYQGEE